MNIKKQIKINISQKERLNDYNKMREIKKMLIDNI